MSERLEIKGKWHISSKRASQLSGYTSDYIGQLARSGKLSSEMVGKSRFVSEDDLHTYIRQQNISSYETKREMPLRSEPKKQRSAVLPGLPASAPKLLSAGFVMFLLLALLVTGSYVFRGDVVLAAWWEEMRPRVSYVVVLMTDTIANTFALQNDLDPNTEAVAREDVASLYVAPSQVFVAAREGWKRFDIFVDDGFAGVVTAVRSLEVRTPAIQLAGVATSTSPRVFGGFKGGWVAFDMFIDDGLHGLVRVVRYAGGTLSRVSRASAAQVFDIFDSVRRLARFVYEGMCGVIPGGFGCHEADAVLVIDEEAVEAARERLTVEEDSQPTSTPVVSPSSSQSSVIVNASPTIIERVIERTPIVSAAGVTLVELQAAIEALRQELDPRIEAGLRSPRNISVSSGGGSSSGNFLPLSGGTLTGSLIGTDGTFSGALSSATLSVSASTTFNGVEYLFPGSDGTNGQALTTDGAGGLSWTTISGGGGSDTNWSFFNGSGVRLATTTNQVLIGALATTTSNVLEVIGSGYFSGNVGIGTTTPAEQLSVANRLYVGGTGTSTIEDNLGVLGTLQVGTGSIYLRDNATSTFAGGIDISTGCFAINGVCVGGGSSLWTQSGSDIYYDAGNVGIGTTSPYAKLSVVGPVVAEYFHATSTTAANSLLLPQVNDASTPTLAFGDGDTGFYESADDSLGVSVAGDSQFTFLDNGTHAEIQATGSNWFRYSTAGAGGHIWYVAGGTGIMQLNSSIGLTNTDSDKWGLDNVDPTATDPNILPRRADGDTGIGYAGADQLSLIAGGVEILQLDSASSTFASALEVLDTATSTFAQGIDLSGGCFALNGVCVGGGGGGTPGGFDTQLQYNNGGSFGGTTGITWDDSGELLTIQAQADSASEQVLRLFGPDRATPANNDEVYLSFYNETSTGFQETGRIVSQTNASANPTGHLYFQLADGLGGFETAFELDRGGGETQARLKDGTAGRPSLTFQSNNDDGFYLPANGIVNVAINGGEKIEFTSRGLLVGAGSISGIGGDGNTNVLGLLNGTDPTMPLTNGTIFYSTDINGGGDAGLALLTESGTTHTFGTNIGVASTSPWRTLSVDGTVAFNGLTTAGATEDALCVTSGGEVVVNTGAQDCNVSSERFKENIEELTAGLDEVLALRPVSFTYIDGDESDVHVGLLAEDVEQVEPRLVFYGDDNHVRGVRYNEMVALLISAIQELSARVDALAKRIGNSVAAVVKSLTVGSREQPAGITLYDETTSEPYCLSVRNGRTITRSGACEEREVQENVTSSESVEGETEEVEDFQDTQASTTPQATTTPETSSENEEASTTPERISGDERTEESSGGGLEDINEGESGEDVTEEETIEELSSSESNDSNTEEVLQEDESVEEEETSESEPSVNDAVSEGSPVE